MNKRARMDLNQRTKEFALWVIRLFVALPKSVEAHVLGRQVLRSGTSFGANWGGRARMFGCVFLAKSGDRLRELAETQYWLELLIESGIVKERKPSAICDQASESAAI